MLLFLLLLLKWELSISSVNSQLFFLNISGLLEKLTAMNIKLEEIQKALDLYLETKRQIFPRFYFLSNDDVLEILGQSQNPQAMQPHLKKCFDNIKSLRMEATVSETRSHRTSWFLNGSKFVKWDTIYEFYILNSFSFNCEMIAFGDRSCPGSLI